MALNPLFLANVFRRTAGVVVAVLAGWATVNMVFNNTYQWGATLYDSTMFSTIIWHCDYQLQMPPALDGRSFLYAHISPIQYIPCLISYIFPGDRIAFFALLYGAIYGALVWVAYRFISSLADGWVGIVL